MLDRLKAAQNLMKEIDSDEIHPKDHERPLVIRVLRTIVLFTKVTFREFLEDRLFLKSMALTFASLLALIPVLVISFSVFKLFGGAEWFSQVVRPLIIENLAPGSGPIVAERLQDVIEKAGGATLGGLGVLFLVVAVYGIFAGIESAFNAIWGVTISAGGLARLPLYWGMLTIIPILMIGSFAISTYIMTLPLVSSAVDSVNYARQIINSSLPVLMLIAGLYLLYKFLPKATVKNRAALTGALIAGLLHELMKNLFIIYTGRLVHYDVIYGSLAVLPILLIWINYTWIVVLLGVEASFVVQHWQVLISRRKHVQFSRDQEDALAHLMLVNATEAFRGLRPSLTVAEWSNNGVPPAITNDVVDKLEKGGLIKRVGKDGTSILISRDPDTITLREIDEILAGETQIEWSWPNEPNWNQLHSLLTTRRELKHSTIEIGSLGQLVHQLSINGEHTGQKLL